MQDKNPATPLQSSLIRMTFQCVELIYKQSIHFILSYSFTMNAQVLISFLILFSFKSKSPFAQQLLVNNYLCAEDFCEVR